MDWVSRSGPIGTELGSINNVRDPRPVKYTQGKGKARREGGAGHSNKVLDPGSLEKSNRVKSLRIQQRILKRRK